MLLGALLEASGAEKKTLDRLLGGPRNNSREVSPKKGYFVGGGFWGSKGGSKIGPPFGSFLRAFWSSPGAFWTLSKSTFGYQWGLLFGTLFSACKPKKGGTAVSGRMAFRKIIIGIF